MVNDNLPPAAPVRDSVSKSDDTVTTTAASSVDLSSRQDSDLAQAFKNQTGPSLNFLQGFSIDMGAETAGTTSGTANRYDSGTSGGEIKDGPYRSSDTGIKDDVYRLNDKDGRDAVRDDVYRLADRDRSDAVRDDVYRLNDRDRTNSVRDDLYRLSDYKANGTAKEPAPVGALARTSYAATNDSQSPQPMDQPQREIRPNGNHPAGGGGDDTGRGGNNNGADPKPTPTPDSELPHTTDPADRAF